MTLRQGLLRLSALTGLFLLPSCAFANMLINYHTSGMSFDREFSSEVNADPKVIFPSDFFYWREMAFEVSFITPDFELYTGAAQHFRFDNSVVEVKAHSLRGNDFLNPLVLASGSYLEIYTYPDEEQPSYFFSLTFSEMGDPADNIFSSGALTSWGRLGTTPENYDEFVYSQFNWPYTRHDQTWYHDTTTYFVDANTNGMSIEKISVTEPFAPALLLIGLGLIRLRARR